MERFSRICNLIMFLCVLRGSCCLGSLENLELGVFSNATNLHWENLTESAAAFPPNTLMIGLTLIQGAAEAGAVCLDGTLPGYHLSEGWGSGARNWLIQLEGGGWCNDQRSCLYRKTTRRGSSKRMERAIGFVGILSNKHSENPDFYNWNRIKLRYCDGASFTGDREGDKRLPKTFFRGQRIWQAGIQDLLAKGMNKAQNALLSGCSAGGLASIIHCDEFREMMPKKSRVKCLSDAGFFLDTTDIAGERTLRSMFKGVVDIQGATKFLPRSCTSRMDPAQCFFPQHLIRSIKTPLFILNAAYDSWQIMSSLVPTSADHDGKWKTCRLDISKCSKGQLQLLHEFRDHMINALQQFSTNPVNGLFINSCFAHCQTEKTDTWFSVGSPKLKKSVAESVGDWYFERKSTNLNKNIDCPYPCDKSCHNLSFKPKKKTQLAS